MASLRDKLLNISMAGVYSLQFWSRDECAGFAPPSRDPRRVQGWHVYDRAGMGFGRGAWNRAGHHTYMEQHRQTQESRENPRNKQKR